MALYIAYNKLSDRSKDRPWMGSEVQGLGFRVLGLPASLKFRRTYPTSLFELGAALFGLRPRKTTRQVAFQATTLQAGFSPAAGLKSEKSNRKQTENVEHRTFNFQYRILISVKLKNTGQRISCLLSEKTVY